MPGCGGVECVGWCALLTLWVGLRRFGRRPDGGTRRCVCYVACRLWGTPSMWGKEKAQVGVPSSAPLALLFLLYIGRVAF